PALPPPLPPCHALGPGPVSRHPSCGRCPRRGGYVWSGRLTYRAHVEVTHSNRWHRRPREPVAPLPGQRDLGSPDFAEPAEQVDRALVEPKVIHGAGDLAPPAPVDSVPCDAAE